MAPVYQQYQPTQEGFLAFLRGTPAIPAQALPDDDVQIGYAFDVAHETVNCSLQTVSPLIYMLAVYNLGTDLLLNWVTDQPGQTYFETARKNFGINEFTGGLISSSADEATSESRDMLNVFKDLTIGQLQNLKTPYGRQYLAWAQQYGTIWGLS